MNDAIGFKAWPFVLILLAIFPRPLFAEPEAATGDEVMLLGPLTLAEVYSNMEDIKKDLISNGGGPDLEAMKAAFKECKIYILDKRVRSTDSGEWRFPSTKEGYPKIVLEGELSFDFTLKNGQKFHVNVNKIEFRGSRTVVGNNPRRDLSLSVLLDTSPYVWNSGKGVGFRFPTKVLSYDFTRKVVFPVLEKK
jgi:hypothetical protein